MAEPAAAAPWLLEHETELREAAALGPVLDLACGRGRHATQVASWGLPVVGVDRNATALRELSTRSAGLIQTVCADLEEAPSLPFREEAFGAILVFRYLHRPLCPALAKCLRPGGVLLYETFTTRQRDLGYGPKNEAFLLMEGELPTLFPELEVDTAHEGLSDADRPLHLAGLRAHRPR